MKDIVLTTINSKWIHPSLALRLLKANLGELEDRCEIIEFNLRQPLNEKIDALLAARPRVLGFSVSIWNHLATLELLAALETKWAARPIIVLGGPEVSHLPPEAEIFMFADYVVRGEGEEVFKQICKKVLAENMCRQKTEFISAEPADLVKIKSAYHLYTDEDLAKKLVYVEASRGCPFKCEFCLSAADEGVREFPLEPFLNEMDALVKRGARTFKFLDRTFNVNIKRALRIINFFLEKIEERKDQPLTVHFETVPSLFPPELCEALSRFPPGSLRLEIGIQTLNAEVSQRIGRPSNPTKELETLCLLREKTNAIIHADLIAGLPGENLASFGAGFDRLWLALSGEDSRPRTALPAKLPFEIQLGVLKLLPGAPISRHNEIFKMRYNPLPPYEIEENSSVSAQDFIRIKNFVRFWELIINRGIAEFSEREPVFGNFLTFSDKLYAYFGRNWGIDKDKLLEFIKYEGISIGLIIE